MHSYMFLFTVNTSLGRSTIFGLAISSAALINVSQQVGFSSHIFPGMYITVDYLPYLGLYILHGVFPKPWPFRKILRNPLHSWGFPSWLLMSDALRRRLWSFWSIFWLFPRKLNCLSRLISSGISSLVSGFPIFWPLVCRRVRGLFLVP